MFYKIEKIENRLNELDRYRYRHTKQVDSFSMYEPKAGEETLLPSEYSNEKMQVNDTWSGRDRYVWLHTKLEIPTDWEADKVVLFLDLGRTGGGNNSGFESLLYIDKQPFQGVDSNHQEVILPIPCPDEVEVDILLWSGLEGGGQQQEQFYRLKEAWYGILDEKVDGLYYLSKALLDSVKQQDVHDPNRAAVLSLLNDAFHIIDWTMPSSEEFYETLYQACDHLEDRLRSMEKKSEVTIHTIGHSHIDLAWLWRVKHTKEKAKRTFSTVLRLAELYPDYIYLQSQPQLYQWVKEEDPELYEEIKEKVKAGQWEVEGAMWVEADCNIPSGESFVRQLLYGKQFIKNEFGKESNTLWLPDVFGYSWSLPQILKKSGIDTFMTTKISWNQYNRMPHDTFKWKGIDGTEILTHFITTPEPGREEDSWFYTYNGVVTAETVKGIWEKYRNKNINNDLLLAYGYGDGGGGVNREMLEMKRQFNKIPSMPNVVSTKADAYFSKLHENISNTNEYLHTWDGELYLEYHRGTYTSQAKMKKQNRRLENAYRQAELLSAWDAMLIGWEQYPSTLIESGWKKILLNQFHDIIPGSSIPEVYEDADKDYEEANSIYKSLIERHHHEAMEHSEQQWSALNPHQYASPTLVTVPENKVGEDKAFAMKGRMLPSQKTENGDYLVLLEDIQPFSYHAIQAVDAKASAEKPLSQVNLDERTWETPAYMIEWNEWGQLTRIYDKHEHREIIPHGEKGNVFKLFEDKPLAHDAWDIDLFYIEKPSVIDELSTYEIIENGPLRTTLKFAWSRPHVEIVQYVHCYNHSQRIDFETEVNWTARQQLLKVEFPVDIRTSEAIFDIQFGNVKRPTHWNTSWDMARFETVGHKWAALAEPYYGVSLMNDSKYGYSVKDHVLSLTLLKGAIHPDPKADIGFHQFTYSILPFRGEGNKREVERESTYLNTDIKAVEGEHKKPYDRSLVTLSSDQVVVDTIKKAENSNRLIIRLHEMEGARGVIDLTTGYKVTRWREVNLMEDIGLTEYLDTPMTLTFSPYEIKTVEVDLSTE